LKQVKTFEAKNITIDKNTKFETLIQLVNKIVLEYCPVLCLDGTRDQDV